jgi:flagellar biosynthesis protein FliQ
MYVFTDLKTALLIVILVPVIVAALIWGLIKWLFFAVLAVLTSPWFWVPALVLVALLALGAAAGAKNKA